MVLVLLSNPIIDKIKATTAAGRPTLMLVCQHDKPFIFYDLVDVSLRLCFFSFLNFGVRWYKI